MKIFSRFYTLWVIIKENPRCHKFRHLQLQIIIALLATENRYCKQVFRLKTLTDLRIMQKKFLQQKEEENVERSYQKT